MVEEEQSVLHPEPVEFQDAEYIYYIRDLIEHSEVLRLRHFTHHRSVNCLEHSLHVSYASYRICKRLGLDYKAAARGGLLHDFFLYDWREEKHDEGMHAFVHPKIALRNASRHFAVSPKEADIIVKHMWPLTIRLPKSPEAFIVSMIDKVCAVAEASGRSKMKRVRRLQEILAF